MSAIWDLIRQAMEERAIERRRSSRQCVYFPLFVYGHTSSDEPFYQETNTLEVNANGGLLHLDEAANVRRGQKLLVMNRLTKEEQECYVVTLKRRPRRADLRVGVAFAKEAPEFWRQRRAKSA